MYCSGGRSNYTTSDFFKTSFLLINNMTFSPRLFQYIRATSIAVSSFNMHSSVDFLQYYYTLFNCLLRRPLNTHDVIYRGTKDLILV